LVSPRAVQATKPETVKIPRPPITGKPAEERLSTRDSKNQDANKNRGKDKNK
jgi:hypothetical protein